ncbi:preprotein translocase subunit SecE [candidate division KSB1 bacterium]|nr:MAG: preprotein translocase subunit SecE [candidate division KSB1 bacterium]
MFKKLFKFLADVKVEMNKVSWPTKEELLNSTYVVIIVSALLAVFIFGVDYILSSVLKLFLR